jgi:predicted molibdopterin-dependent oxidoreductase YjgC
MAKVTFTVNGKTVEAEEGQTILEATQAAGIDIPTLCYHRDLTPTGNCRMCVVEVKGQRFLQAACVFPVTVGLMVETQSERVMKSRRRTLELMLADHPQDCLTCDLGGDCELQDLAYEYQVSVPEWGAKGARYVVDSDPNPFVRVDFNKCILCRRCVLACAEIQGRDVWSVAYRGFDEQIVAGAGVTMLEARCESCGQCSAYCPTGALSDRMSHGLGRPHQVTKVTTTCVYCGVGCQFDLNVKDGRVIRVTSNPNAPVNGMALCVKGRYGYDFIHHPDRLERPLVRAQWLDPIQIEQRTAIGEWRMAHGAEHIANGEWQRAGSQSEMAEGKKRKKTGNEPLATPAPALSRDPEARSGSRDPGRPGAGAGASHKPSPWVEVDWDTALDVVAGKFAEIKRESGGDALAVLTSAKCTNEENYLVNKLARQMLGTNSIDHCARL